jgi:hypothetical protein
MDELSENGTGAPILPTRGKAGEGYYIYGLVDPLALHQIGDQLLSIFYVGKGSRSRWAHHETEERRALNREEVLLVRHSSKAERIRKILDRGQQVPAIRLSARLPKRGRCLPCRGPGYRHRQRSACRGGTSAADQRHTRAPRGIRLVR